MIAVVMLVLRIRVLFDLPEPRPAQDDLGILFRRAPREPFRIHFK